MLEHIPEALRRKLVNLLGERKAQELVIQVLGEMRQTTIHNADDCFTFGHILCKRGGMYDVLGKSIQTQAILKGAQKR